MGGEAKGCVRINITSKDKRDTLKDVIITISRQNGDKDTVYALVKTDAYGFSKSLYLPIYNGSNEKYEVAVEKETGEKISDTVTVSKNAVTLKTYEF